MAKSTAIGSPTMQMDSSEAKAATSPEKKRGFGSSTIKMGTRRAKRSSAMAKTRAIISPIMKTAIANGAARIENTTAARLTAEKKGSGSATKKMARRCGVSSPTRRAEAARNPMNIRSGFAMFAGKADVQRGAIPVRNVA